MTKKDRNQTMYFELFRSHRFFKIVSGFGILIFTSFLVHCGSNKKDNSESDPPSRYTEIESWDGTSDFVSGAVKVEDDF